MIEFWPRFVLAALAVWRLSHPLAPEDGPFDLVIALRIRLGDAGRVLDCFFCVSPWVAAPMAFFVSPGRKNGWCIWLALAGAAGQMHRFSERGAMRNEREIEHGMLWTETNPAGQARGAGPAAAWPGTRGDTRRTEP